MKKLFLFILLLCGGMLSATNYYVAPTTATPPGSNVPGCGGSTNPCATIAYADTNIALTGGDTVIVRAGTYSTLNTVLKKSGLWNSSTDTCTSRLVWKSETKYGAKLVAPASTSIYSSIVDLGDGTATGGRCVDLQDFEMTSVTGATCTYSSVLYHGNCNSIGVDLRGRLSRAVGNYIHDLDISVAATVSQNGGCGICSSAFSLTDSTYNNRKVSAIGNKVVNVGRGTEGTNNNRKVHNIYFDNYGGYIANNISIMSPGAGISISHAGAATIVNNTVVGNRFGGILHSSGGVQNNNVTLPATIMQNNLSYDNAWDTYATTTGLGEQWNYDCNFAPTVAHNNMSNSNVKGNYKWGCTNPTNGHDYPETPINEVPQMVDYQRSGSGDYTPTASSNLNGRGYASGAPTTDFNGNTRPNPPSIGALEAGGSAPPPPPPSNGEYYIATTSNCADTNSGASGYPWCTFAHALTVVQPGNIVHVGAGTYTFNPTLTLSKSGISGSPITWVSDIKGAAKIVSNGSACSPAPCNDWNNAVAITGDWVVFKGFEVYSTNSTTLNTGISMVGSNITVEGNIVHDIPAPGPVGVGGAGIASSTYNIVNRVWSTGNKIVGNFVFNIGNYLNPSTLTDTHCIATVNHNTYIANNIVHHCQSYGISAQHAADHVTIVNNDVSNSGYGGILIRTSTVDNGGTKPDAMYVANNISYHNGVGTGGAGYGIYEQVTTSDLGYASVYTNNVVYDNHPNNWMLTVTGGTGLNTYTQDPVFVNFTSLDFHLGAGSPAINNGTTSAQTPTTDIDGNTRPYGGATDIGAYESSSTGVPLPPTLLFVTPGLATGIDAEGLTWPLTLPQAAVAGNTVVLAISWGGYAGDGTVTVVDNAGNSYFEATHYWDTRHAQGLAVFYKVGISGAPTAFTVTFGKSAPFRRVVVHEYSGITSFGGSATAIGSGSTNVSCGSNTFSGSALVFAAVMDDQGTNTFTQGSNFVLRLSTMNDLQSEDGTFSATTVVPTFTMGTAHDYMCHSAYFNITMPPAKRKRRGGGVLN